jgi:hypothetical protein
VNIMNVILLQLCNLTLFNEKNLTLFDEKIKIFSYDFVLYKKI